MAQNKLTRKELLEIEVRLEEIDRAQAYLNREYHERRKVQLLERAEDIQDKLDKKEIAPDIQFILMDECDGE